MKIFNITLAIKEMLMKNNELYLPETGARSPIEEFKKLEFQITGITEEIKYLDGVLGGTTWGSSFPEAPKYQIKYSCFFVYPGDGIFGKDLTKRKKIYRNTIDWAPMNKQWTSSKLLVIPIPTDLHGRDIEHMSFRYEFDSISKVG